MTSKALIVAALLCIVLCIGLAVDTNSVHAQNSKTIGNKGTQLATKEWDKDKLPGKLEISLGVGSIFVMIAVMKWV